MTMNAPCTSALPDLLDLPVRHRGITLGRVTDVLLDEQADSVLGLIVVSVAGEPTFLPWPSLELGEGEVEVPYALALLSEAELDYYRGSSRSLVDLIAADGEPAVAAG